MQRTKESYSCFLYFKKVYRQDLYLQTNSRIVLKVYFRLTLLNELLKNANQLESQISALFN